MPADPARMKHRAACPCPWRNLMPDLPCQTYPSSRQHLHSSVPLAALFRICRRASRPRRAHDAPYGRRTAGVEHKIRRCREPSARGIAIHSSVLPFAPCHQCVGHIAKCSRKRALLPTGPRVPRQSGWRRGAMHPLCERLAAVYTSRLLAMASLKPLSWHARYTPSPPDPAAQAPAAAPYSPCLACS